MKLVSIFCFLAALALVAAPVAAATGIAATAHSEDAPSPPPH